MGREGGGTMLGGGFITAPHMTAWDHVGGNPPDSGARNLVPGAGDIFSMRARGTHYIVISLSGPQIAIMLEHGRSETSTPTTQTCRAACHRPR
jgi:hypothetical protein